MTLNLPEGATDSRFEGVEDLAVAGADGRNRTIAAWVHIPRGETTELVARFRLPAGTTGAADRAERPGQPHGLVRRRGRAGGAPSAGATARPAPWSMPDRPESVAAALPCQAVGVWDYLEEFVPIIGAAALVTLLTTPVLRWLSFRVGAVVAPDERRVHTRPLAVLGGGALLLGFLTGMAVAWRGTTFDDVFAASTVPLGVALAAITIFARRADRRPPRGVAAGQARRHGAGRAACCRSPAWRSSSSASRSPG